jgi:UDP-2,3-diacylglucosamine pyrophosphatase LpxH
VHQRLLHALQSVANVRLVAALRDERLGLPFESDLRIFIPDVHLISDQRRIQGGFRYASNHTGLLTRVAGALKDLTNQRRDGETITTYQIGDLFDLWRESSGVDTQLDVAARIKLDHEDLIHALCDAGLNIQFMLGNHDFDLYRWPNYAGWARRYYFPRQAPSVLLLHGDIYDWIERLPDGIQDLIVFLFAPHAPSSEYELGKMHDEVRKVHAGKRYRAFLQNADPAPLGATRSTDDSIPQRWNVQQEGTAPAANLKFLDTAYASCRKANADYQLNLKVAVIGHTHHARIAVKETPEGELFTLIDCGAWIEECIAEGDTAPAPNAQIAALSANEARIYQLSPK